MKIDLSTVLVQLDGTPFKDGEKDVIVGVVLSNCLENAKEGGRMKMYALATKCYAGGIAEFDEADISMMKKVVEAAPLTSNVVAGQILLLLEKVK